MSGGKTGGRDCDSIRRKKSRRPDTDTITLLTVTVGNSTVSGVGWPANGSCRELFRFPTQALARSSSPAGREAARIVEKTGKTVSGSGDGLTVVWAGVVPAVEESLGLLLRNFLPGQVLRFRREVLCKLRVEPRPATAVGDDRLAAALGALAHDGRRPSVVVDAGTALTVDAVLPPNRFLGGLIVPGAELCLRALSRGAARLPELSAAGAGTEVAEPAAAVGRSTEEAMRFGTARLLSAFVVSAVRAQRKELQHRSGRSAGVVVTGGGADGLGKLPAAWRPVYDAFLVQRGLREAFLADRHRPCRFG